VAQVLLPFQYESEAGEAGLTGLAGLPLYLELWRTAGLDEAVARHVAVSGAQGCSDRQMVSALAGVRVSMISTGWRRTPGCAGLCGWRRHGRSRRGGGRARCPRRMRRASGLRDFTTPARKRGRKPDGRSSRRRARPWRARGG
jgi:hypothetical protein